MTRWPPSGHPDRESARSELRVLCRVPGCSNLARYHVAGPHPVLCGLHDIEHNGGRGTLVAPAPWGRP